MSDTEQEESICQPIDYAVGIDNCGDFTVRTSVVVLFTLLGILLIVIVVLTFTHCLKVRMVRGRKRLVCRKSVGKGSCLLKRPRPLVVIARVSPNRKLEMAASPIREESGIVPAAVKIGAYKPRFSSSLSPDSVISNSATTNRGLEATMGFGSSLGASSILPQLVMVRKVQKKDMFEEGHVDIFNDKAAPDDSNHTDIEAPKTRAKRSP